MHFIRKQAALVGRFSPAQKSCSTFNITLLRRKITLCMIWNDTVYKNILLHFKKGGGGEG